MSRHSRCRELQASMRGLENLYQTLDAKAASACRAHSRVLIVGGCGGREIEFLARHEIAASLTIVDPSPGNLSDARSLAQDVGYLGAIEIVEGTVDCLPESPKFDVATIIFVLHSSHDATTEVRLLQAESSRMTGNATLFLADIPAKASNNSLVRPRVARKVPIVRIVRTGTRSARQRIFERVFEAIAGNPTERVGRATTSRFWRNICCNLIENGPGRAMNGTETCSGRTAQAAINVSNGKKIAKYCTLAHVMRTCDGVDTFRHCFNCLTARGVRFVCNAMRRSAGRAKAAICASAANSHFVRGL